MSYSPDTKPRTNGIQGRLITKARVVILDRDNRFGKTIVGERL